MLSLYNTLTKQVEEIRTVEPGVARIYTCGPTVYRYAHIGNLRTYLMADWIRRVLAARGLEVRHVKNITDVGHMRQELVEAGGDKMILSALAEGKSVEQIAQFYEDSFHRDEARVNILPAAVFPRATHHVPEMVSMVQRLLDNQLAYEAGGNVYFAVGRFPEYGKLSRNVGSDLLEGVRVETDPLKHDPRDFTLWKAAEPGRDLKWDSPWGPGFPGWHIECSAMAHKYLGERFDIHTGGVDNVFPHHEDEIAQSEGTFGHQHVSYWVHGQHLLADGAKMAKSGGNVFLLDDLIARGFDPLAFRYLCLTVRYRHRMNFTFTALKASERALTGLRHRVWTWKGRVEACLAPTSDAEEWRQRFWAAVENDLDLPTGLAVTWEMVRSGLPEAAKLALLLEFNQVFGLDLDRVPAAYRLPGAVAAVVQQRQTLRQQEDYVAADARRAEAQAVGYQVEDTRRGCRVRPKSSLEQRLERWPSVSSGREVESLLDQPAKYEFTLLLNAYDYQEDVARCVEAMLRYSRGYSAEILVVDNGSTDGSAQWLESMQARQPNLRVIHCDHVLGDAAGKNIGVKQSLGANLVLLDASTEIVGDVLDPIRRRLADPSVGIYGPYGLTSADFKHFHDNVVEGEADAIQGYCMAFRREAVNRVGLMRECFRFYRNLDIDYSFQFKDRGYHIIADGRLPLVRHEHRQWFELDEGQRDELSRKNFGRFLKRWGNRTDLLIAGPPAPAPAHGHDHDHDHGHEHDHDHHQH
ncbi:MAG: cysteine--tRNA ligase [Dehalococcoidia bacterium]|nr:cysteine--tRNA ligase [Dehalococcoidia bacterium]MSQ16976.1 cysteine--tRNA ligase [Dehalococcoidia bacterium]